MKIEAALLVSKWIRKFEKCLERLQKQVSTKILNATMHIENLSQEHGLKNQIHDLLNVSLFSKIVMLLYARFKRYIQVNHPKMNNGCQKYWAPLSIKEINCRIEHNYLFRNINVTSISCFSFRGTRKLRHRRWRIGEVLDTEIASNGGRS